MDVIMPQLGETVAEGIVAKWHKKVGDSVAADEMLFDVETDKVSTEIPAPVAGVITEILVPEGATVKVGTRLAVISDGKPEAASGNARSASAVAPVVSPVHKATPASAARVEGTRLSPVVRRLFAEHGLKPRDVTGTGRDGRIKRDDVLTVIAAPGAAKRGGTDRRRLNAVRRRTAEHMAKTWKSVPHVMQAVEVDFQCVDEVRAGTQLSYLPFIASAVAAALKRYPLLNASLDGYDLLVHERINIGIAVDLNFEGLVVPVVKDVAGKSVNAIAAEMTGLAQRARSGKLRPDEVTQGTYTLSNSGSFGTLFTGALINEPQVAILSTDGVRKKPVVVEGADGDRIIVRPVGVLVQSFDHRAVDGAYSAAFLKELKNILETRDWTQALKD
jgi:2-oxoglutarate dehydrogenase E2 component (dihydrolipoamide succinyltransferase)